MDISLRRAAQIINSLRPESGTWQKTAAAATRSMLPSAVEVSATFSIDTAEVPRVAEQRDVMLKRFGDTLILQSIEMRLRKALARKNMEIGITDLVTERAMLLRTQKLYNDIIGGMGNKVFDADAFNKIIAGMRERIVKRESHSSRDEQLSVMLFTQADVGTFRNELVEVNRRLAAIDERLAQLNSNGMVEINDDDWTRLREFKIV